jgi:methionyl-tRNA formyltransferase
MQLDKGCDTGPVYLQKTCAISPDDTSETLLNKLTLIGAQALIDTLEMIDKGTAQATPQDNAQSSYAPKIDKQDGCLNWNLSAFELDCMIRAYQPWPLAYTFIHGNRINITQAKPLNPPMQSKPGTILSVDKTGVNVATGQGVLHIQMVQLPGKKPMPISALLNGRPDFFQPGMVFDAAP